MAGNLTSQVRNIAEVTTAVAQGNLTKKITVEVKGEILELRETINKMVDQLTGFSSEVTRIAREVGTDGKLGGQADVPGVAGVWKDLTDNVNAMAGNLTSQVRNIAEVTRAVAGGDLSKKITADVRGEFLQLKEIINTMVDQLRGFADEVTRVAREVGTDGRLGGQAIVPGVAGTWKDLTDNVNGMASNLTSQVRNIATVTTAVANGDLSRKITVDVKGEVLELKNTINAMVDQLSGFAGEVTRIAREVGTEGKLGGQAQVRGTSGVWRDLTDNVNVMASNLTDQVRNIVKIVTLVAGGNLKQKFTLLAKGEIAQLADTINNMIDTLSTFSDQVTNVAKEVGVEGKLGGQANVPGAAGTWKDLIDNVNQLAANLTNQIRAIAEVSTAVTKGDFTRSITVEARGEVALLKDNLNQMIHTLSDTTVKTTEQDWLKTNLTKFARMLQGQRDIEQVAHALLSELAPVASIQHGIFYILEEKAETQTFKLLASYGYKERKNLASVWGMREGLVGQCAYEKQPILLTNVPPDYVQIISGLGQATPLNIIDLPVLFEGKVKAVIELASFDPFTPIRQSLLEQLSENLGVILNTIEASVRTENLLKQSQNMSEELQTQQEELQQTNEELEEKAKQLNEQKDDLQRNTVEIEGARRELESKATQLEITSRYKSQFLSNMSHELRTPLNSLLILSQQLEENREGNLTPKQVEFAKTIHGSGNDLLILINDILDLSKIESGTVSVERNEILLRNITAYLESQFLPVAKTKKLKFETLLGDNLPEGIITDERRLYQILKNLLSNAFKFTEKGSVELSIDVVKGGWSSDHTVLNQASQVIAFSVKDTGIGIADDKRGIVFEAFQQADGTTSRKYGGTGLGLAISRELAYLLGGEIRLVETGVGKGSTFVLYLPQRYSGGWRGIGRQLAVSREEEKGIGPIGHIILPPSPDDRNNIKPTDQVLLIVEDDPAFANVLLDMAHNKGFKAVVTDRGEEAIKLTQTLKPQALTLDLRLPDIDGWTVLDRLKLDSSTRHIPVHIISIEDDVQYGLNRGAFAYLTKPVTKEKLEEAFQNIAEFVKPEPKELLVIEDNEADQKIITTFLGNGDIKTTVVASGKEAFKAFKSKRFDCVVLDLRLPDMPGAQILEKIKKDPKLADIPIIVYTAKDISREEELALKKSARAVIVKGEHSLERLLAETALFLHRVTLKLPKEKRQIVENLYKSEKALAGKKVLLVDDDVRNLFALTSILESHNMAVLTAENGKEALSSLQKNPEVDIVLIDIMMPEMDGYEVTRQVRKLDRFKQLPILALTAKAMKGDREKCLEAGASDYITKPVNTDQLLSMMRVWLYR
jgi:CheY-like chemotaxis protein/signal transduction histidine kinase/HAMP domain-containing protein